MKITKSELIKLQLLVSTKHKMWAYLNSLFEKYNPPDKYNFINTNTGEFIIAPMQIKAYKERTVI